MGINGRLDLYDYWSMSPELHCYPIASVISRKRFLEIKRYLHFVDNTSLSFPCCDKLAKIWSVLEAARNTCLTSYNPYKDNSIDKARHRGDFVFQQKDNLVANDWRQEIGICYVYQHKGRW